jgi:uncharacterized protein (DUF2141 family)
MPKLNSFIFFLSLDTFLVACILSGLCYGENDDSSSEGQYGNLHVIVAGFHNKKGLAQFALFNSEKGFPDQVQFAYRIKSLPTNPKRVEVVFEKISFGIYAVGVLHDENANGILDKNFIGMPKEGTGTSNNVQGKIGPPSFGDAKFIVNTENVTIKISIFY